MSQRVVLLFSGLDLLQNLYQVLVILRISEFRDKSSGVHYLIMINSPKRDTIGPIGFTAEDVAIVLDAMTDNDGK